MTPECAPRRLVTADWLERRLSIFDLAQLEQPESSLEAAALGTIELAGYAPGPLQLAVHPDGRRAVVVVGPGFFGGFVGNVIGAGDVPGGGVVLLVDLLTGEVLSEVETPQPPMGVILDPAGTRAFVANYGDETTVGSTVSVIDLETGSLLGSVEVGARPEQLAWTDDGVVVNAAGDGLAVLLDDGVPVPSVRGQVQTSDDPSYPLWSGALPNQVLMTDSQGAPGLSLVDIATPSAPAVATRIDMAGFPYAIAQGSSPEEVWVLASVLTRVDVHRVSVGELTLLASPPVAIELAGFPLGAAWIDGDLWFAVPGDGALVAFDPDSEVSTVRDWPASPGPTWIAVAESTCP